MHVSGEAEGPEGCTSTSSVWAGSFPEKRQTLWIGVCWESPSSWCPSRRRYQGGRTYATLVLHKGSPAAAFQKAFAVAVAEI